MTLRQRPLLTPSAQRTIDRCRAVMAGDASARRWLVCLLDELFRQESLAAACLNRMGVERSQLLAAKDGVDQDDQEALMVPASVHVEERDAAPGGAELNDPLEFTQVLDRAMLIARRRSTDESTSSEDLLLAAVEVSDFVGELLNRFGVSLTDLRRTLAASLEAHGDQITVDEAYRLSWADDSRDLSAGRGRLDLIRGADSQTPAEFTPAGRSGTPSGIPRVLDANLNRAREGLRVLEDYCRFLMNDSSLSWQLKLTRHELVAATALLGGEEYRDRLLQSRDTAGDVGTDLTTTGEFRRDNLIDLVIANSRRVQESLRSLEEFGKLIAPEFAAAVKQQRYRCYVLEQQLAAAASAFAGSELAVSGDRGSAIRDPGIELRQRLELSRVYVLLTEEFCRKSWREVAEQALSGGADVLQLREKSLGDRELAARARWLSDACRAAGALCVVNDRADIARLTNASGLHVGQDELTVAEARGVLRAEQLLGLSTHGPQQAVVALANDVDYLGVGPVFPSTTKTFAAHAGLEYVRWCAGNVEIPWFAIGGISLSNVPQVIAAGARRVAVTSAVTDSNCPADVVRELKSQLQHAD